MTDRIEFLRKLTMFSDLDGELIREVASVLKAKHVPRGRMLFFVDEPGETLYFVQKGLIKIFCISEDGREKTLSLLEQGDVFGEMAVLDNKGRSANAQALHDSTLFLLYKDTFLKILRKHPELAHRMLYILVKRLREADRQITELAFKNARQRVALLLLRLARKYGKQEGEWLSFQIGLNQEEIGHLTGCTRETVNRLYSDLCQKKLLVLSRKVMQLKATSLEKIVSSL